MADLLIKPDPEAAGASPSPFGDEDIYEDAGDLEFHADPNFQKLYLARLPKYLWEEWAKLEDDAEIRLGTIRQSEETDSNGVKRHKLQMLLRSDFAAHQTLPKEYELQVTAETVQNTFVFTEKDLPGFKSKSREAFDPATANMPARLNRSRVDKSGEKQAWDKSKRGQQNSRRIVPKKTTLAGRVAHEVNAIAVMNEETKRIMAQRTHEEMKPKSGTIFIPGASSNINSFVQPGTVLALGAFGGFIKNTGTTKGKATHETKTARMPENELLDRIFAAFKEFNYWSMKALRARLQQPEAYLRETLEKVADMPKSGRFAMHWTLKPEFKNATYEGANDESAPAGIGGLDGAEDSDMADVDGEDDEDDEDVKLEDVMPS